MKEDNKPIPNEYTVNWIQLALLTAIVRNSKRDNLLSKKVRFELYSAYRDGMEIKMMDLL